MTEMQWEKTIREKLEEEKKEYQRKAQTIRTRRARTPPPPISRRNPRPRVVPYVPVPRIPTPSPTPILLQSHFHEEEAVLAVIETDPSPIPIPVPDDFDKEVQLRILERVADALRDELAIVEPATPFSSVPSSHPAPIPAPRRKIPSLMDLVIPRPPGLPTPQPRTRTIPSKPTPYPTQAPKLTPSAAYSIEPIPSTSRAQESSPPTPLQTNTNEETSKKWLVPVKNIKLQSLGSCWRCGKSGHFYRQCKKEKKWQFYLICGFRGVMMKDCPQCGETYRKVFKK